MSISHTCQLIQPVWTKHASSWIPIGLEHTLSCWVFPFSFIPPTQQKEHHVWSLSHKGISSSPKQTNKQPAKKTEIRREIMIFTCKYIHFCYYYFFCTANEWGAYHCKVICKKLLILPEENSHWEAEGPISTSFYHFRNFTMKTKTSTKVTLVTFLLFFFFSVWMLVHTSQRYCT